MLNSRTISHRTYTRTASAALTAFGLLAVVAGTAIEPAHAKDVYPHAKETIGTGQQL